MQQSRGQKVLKAGVGSQKIKADQKRERKRREGKGRGRKKKKKGGKEKIKVECERKDCFTYQTRTQPSIIACKTLGWEKGKRLAPVC